MVFNTTYKQLTSVYFINILSILWIASPQVSSAKTVEFYCKDGTCQTYKPSDYFGFYECYDKDFTKCQNLSSKNSLTTRVSSSTSSSSSRGTPTRTSTTTPSPTKSAATTQKIGSTGAATAVGSAVSTGGSEATTATTPTKATVISTAGEAAVVGSAAIVGTPATTATTPTKEETNKDNTGLTACEGYNKQDYTTILDARGNPINSPIESPYRKCLKERAEKAERKCEEATKEAKKQYDEFKEACRTMDTAWGLGQGSCFKNVKNCNAAAQGDQKSMSNYLAEAALSYHGITTKNQNNSAMSYACPQKSGSSYAKRRDSLERQTEKLKDRQQDLTKELADLKNTREEERVATERELKEAKKSYENTAKENARETEDRVEKLEQESRLQLLSERQKLENEMIAASLTAQAAAQSLFTLSKTFSVEVYNQRCATQAKMTVAKDKNFKGAENAATRKQVAMDIFTDCINKIEGEMFSAKQKAEAEKMASQKRMDDIQQSQKLLDQKVQDTQNKLSQMKQRQQEDANLASKQYMDDIERIANEDKANSTKNQNEAMRLIQELQQINADMNKNANETVANEASAVTKDDDDQKESATALLSKINKSFGDVQIYSTGSNCMPSPACPEAEALCKTLEKELEMYEQKYNDGKSNGAHK